MKEVKESPFHGNPRVCLYCARYQDEKFNVRPLGISYLASFLIDRGVVLAGNLRIVDSLEEAIAFQPDIIGVSSVSQVVKEAREFARRCKEATDCFAILGGYHVSSVPWQLPDEFDVGVIGEGEETFAELIGEYANRGLPEPVLKGITGICFRGEGGLVSQTPLRSQIADIDALPWPLRHKFYSKEEAVFTSRGCPFRCTYCASQSFWRGKTRFRSADSVVDEIRHLVETYKPAEIVILDDLWMADRQRFKTIVNQLVELGIPKQVSFRGFCRSNIIDEETILLLKKLNYRFVRFGAETGSEELLKRIKGQAISVADHQRVVDLCHKHGLRCGASFMFGLPGETVEDLQKTIDFLRKNKKYFEIIGFYLFNPIPGTVLWEELERKGVVSEEFEFERLQLDLLNPDFSWDDILYFNSENIPLNEFRTIVTEIRKEFIQRRSTREKLRRALTRVVKKIFKRVSGSSR